MTITHPLVSVIIPAYNHQRFVAEAIQSVLSQQYPHLELIIIDDASSDKTAQIAQTFQDSRIRFYRNATNRGSAENINSGFHLARGDYMAILNSDDIFTPDRLACLVDSAQTHNAMLIGTDIELIGPDSRPITFPSHWWLQWYDSLKATYDSHHDLAQTLLSGNLFISTSNFFIDKSIFQHVGNISHYAYVQDYDFVLRCLAVCENHIRWLPQKLLKYRLHDHNTIAQNALESNRQTIEIVLKHLPAFFDSPQDQRRLRTVDRHMQKIAGYIELTAGQKQAATDRTAHERQLQTLRRRIQVERLRVSQIRQSYAYRLGRGILLPLRWAKLATAQAGQWRNRRRILKSRLIHSARSLEQVKNLLETRCADTQVVAFDIFDTLLARRVEPPDLIHEAMARYVSAWLGREIGQAIDAGHALAVRRQVERRLRQHAANQGWDNECRFDQLIIGWMQELIGSESATPERCHHARQTELAFEADALIAAPFARELLQWLQATGKTIVLISDMYLRHADLQFLLKAKNLWNLVDHLFVSSETWQCKHSGKLFHHIFDQLHIQPQQMVHIGDNIISDAQAPAALGIRAIHLNHGAENKRRQSLNALHRLSCERPFWRGKHLIQIAGQQGSQPSIRKDFYYQYGHDILGPIFCAYVLAIMERLATLRIDHVYFLARDGYLFQKIYHRLQRKSTLPAVIDTPDTYAYLTRKTTAAAAATNGLTHAMALSGLYNPKQQGLYSVLSTFSLPVAAFAPLAAKHGFSDLKAPILDWHDSRLHAFLADPAVDRRIRAHAAPHKKRLAHYLKQIGYFTHQRIALVDIGWNSSIQFYLGKAFCRPDTPYPHVHGLYFGLINGMPHDFCPNDHFEGLIYDKRSSQAHLAASCREFEELFEESARAADATVVGYAQDDHHRMQPVFKPDHAPDRRKELEANDLICQIQAGILGFCDNFAAAAALTGYRSADLMPYMLTLMDRAIIHPTAEEVHKLTRISHSEDFGGNQFMDMASVRLSWRQPKNWLHLSRRLEQSDWRYGSLVSMKLGWLASYFHSQRLKKPLP